MIKVSASIVIYNENLDTLKRAVDSFCSLEFDKQLVIVDNSKEDLFSEKFKDYKNLNYIFTGKNLGFGKGHNLAFKYVKNSDIHIVLNPDVYFEKEEIEDMIEWMKDAKDISLSVPLVFFPNNKKQFICREIPTFKSLFFRKFNFFKIFEKEVCKDELNRKNFEKIEDVPFCHGCFMMFKTEVFKKLKGFDERFFLYMEDVDIFIRAKKYGRTVVNPSYKIYHEFRKGSSKNLKLFFIHLFSVLKFFFKYKRL